MRFLVDECTGPSVARWLAGEGHDVYSVADASPGITDDEVIGKAYSEDWILVTNDKDFGEKVFRERRPHHGVILLRLADERVASKVTTLQRLIAAYSDRLHDQFVVVTETQIRFAPLR